MTGPSASGSVNGMPTSSTSAPARSSAQRISADLDMSGSPAATYVTRPGPVPARIRSNAASILEANPGLLPVADVAGDAVDIFVATSRQIDEDVGRRAEFLCKAARVCHAVGRFERRDNPFGPCQTLKRVESVVVANPRILGASQVAKPRVFRADRGVVEASRD